MILFIFSTSLSWIFTIGTFSMFIGKICCCRIILIIVPALDTTWIPYGMNFKLVFPSLDILQNRFLSISAFFGDIQISYTCVVILSRLLLSPTSFPYKSNAGMIILSVSFPFESFSVWIIGLLSSSLRSIHMNSCWIVCLRLSRRVTFGLIFLKNQIECSLCDSNFLWEKDMRYG